MSAFFLLQPFGSILLSTGASSLSLSAADFLRLALLLVGTRFFAAFPPPNDLRISRRASAGRSLR
jgi:hypothetical protein